MSNNGKTPEVLTLASMGYRRGLPAGLHDVETIERAQKRRIVESHFQPLSNVIEDPVKMAKYVYLMKKIESDEWSSREREIETLQEIRLNVLIQMLKKREEDITQLSKNRLSRQWEIQSQKVEDKRIQLRHKYTTMLRKVLRKRVTMESPRAKEDMVEKYGNPASSQFAPLTRNGAFPDRKAKRYVRKSHYLDTLEGLNELENTLPQRYFHVDTKIKAIPTHTKDGFLRSEFRHLQELSELQELFSADDVSETAQRRKPKFLEKISPPTPRPETPDLTSPGSHDQLEPRLAAIELQKLIRGRAIQTEMYEGKEKRKELIAELRSTHALLVDEQIVQDKKKRIIQDMQAQYACFADQDKKIEDIIGQLESRSLGRMLDFLSKELDRLLEERRLRAAAMLAERQRRMREAEESGTRERELRRRREEDEIFKQVVKVHQDTVDGYLEMITRTTIDRTADMIATETISSIAQKEHLEACSSELVRDQAQSDLIASDLVYSFLIPEVEKRTNEDKHAMRRHKYLKAAHDELLTASKTVVGMGSRSDPRINALTIEENECNTSSGETKSFGTL